MAATEFAPQTALQFAEAFTDTSVRLFEMDDKVLDELLADGGRCVLQPTQQTLLRHLTHASLAPHGSLAIKGDPKEEAVLCTATRTYLLRLAESSNTLLLTADTLPKAAPADGPPATVTISTSVQSYYELVPTAPRASALPELLAVCPYRDASSGGNMEVDGADEAAAGPPPSSRLTWEQLECALQCSAAELRAALQRARALEVEGGRWCLLEAQYEQDLCGAPAGGKGRLPAA